MQFQLYYLYLIGEINMKGNNSMNTYSTVSGIGSEFCEVSPDGLLTLVKQAPRYKER